MQKICLHGFMIEVTPKKSYHRPTIKLEPQIDTNYCPTKIGRQITKLDLLLNITISGKNSDQFSRDILQTDWRLVSVMSRVPTLTARLVQSHFQNKTKQTCGGKRLRGTFQCGNCNICSRMISSSQFQNPSTA